MKTTLTLFTAGMFLTALGTGFAQPVITKQPATQATAPGTTATFQVGARGTEPLAYQWQKNPGNGFSDLADRTNAALVLANVQPWDACDYRVVVTNIMGARTSAVARLYVLRPPLVTTNVVLDNFDDNLLTGWTVYSSGTCFNTNQQLTVRGYYPGVHTTSLEDSYVCGGPHGTWSIPDGMTKEWRADLIHLDENATDTALLVVGNDYSDDLYGFYVGRDFAYLKKWSPVSGVSILACEKAALRTTNVVLALALTRLQANLVVTGRVLDKADPNTVLYQLSVVDTPTADPTLTTAQFQALTGMRVLNLVSDLGGTPATSFQVVAVGVFQYTDGTKPAVLATFDNLELRTSLFPRTHYVDGYSTNPTPPYTNWLTAATNIQDAVDAAPAGDEIVVTNGLYATGGRAVGTNLLVNRVAVDKPLTLRSVNGPEVTIIQGYQVPGSTNGVGAIRCVYLANVASLSGFTLTNGATLSFEGMAPPRDGEQEGGGVWCESATAVVSNCVMVGNSARNTGGGACSGTLNNCTLTGNAATRFGGGGAYMGTLNSCTLTSNSAWVGGGALSCTLNSCALSGNSAYAGGGVESGILNNCTLTGNSATRSGGGASSYLMSSHCILNNCTLVGNSAAAGGGASGGTLNNCTLIGNRATGTEEWGRGGGVNSGKLNNCIVYSNTAAGTGGNYYFFGDGDGMNYCCTTPMPTNGVGNITNAALFVDYAAGNLRLQSNSHCINAGLNAYAPGPTDLDGLPRIVSGTVDIGAYEYQGSGSLISYAWLQHYGLPTDGSADGTDPDADGHTTWQEWRCLTDPTSELSALRLLTASPAGTNVTVSWQSAEGVNYFLERSTNVAGPPPIFAPLATGIPGQPGTTSYSDTNAASLAPLFYRVGVSW